MNFSKYLRFAVVGACALASCKSGPPTATKPGKYSSTTGLEYNTEEGVKVADYKGIPEGPGLIFIEGGRTVLGSQEEDVTMTHDNIERTVTIASFYMDEAEVANIHWLEYLHYARKDSSEEFYQSALPDTTVWARELSFNDPYVDYYLRYPGFRYFPVVGVSWLQANDYCTWRTAKVNERLASEGDEGGSSGGGGLFKKKKKGGDAAEGTEGTAGDGKTKTSLKTAIRCPTTVCPPRLNGSTPRRPSSARRSPATKTRRTSVSILGMAVRCGTPTVTRWVLSSPTSSAAVVTTPVLPVA